MKEAERAPRVPAEMADRCRRPALLATGIVSIMSLGGCMVGPDFSTPETEVNDTWVETAEFGVKRDAAVDEQWWRGFNDPVLTRLVDEAYANNLDLRTAGVRVLQAMAQRGVAMGEFWPQSQTINGSATRSRASDNFAPEGGPTPPPSNYWNTYSTGFYASWELDFFGKFRRNIEAANAELDATLAGYDDVMVSLIAEVASTYVGIRTLETQLAIVRGNIAAQERAVFLTQEKFDAGATTMLDVTQARARLAQTQGDLAGLEARRRNTVFRLCTLLGRPPSLLEDVLGESGDIPDVGGDIGVGVPAELLRRRPDIRVAERTAAAQSALIGVEKASLYPSFSLNGSIGLQSNDTNRLWRSDSRIGDLGLGFSWPFLNYGRIDNSIRAQDAAFQQAALSYQNTVLNAAQEVESGLASVSGARQQVEKLAEAVANSRLSLELSLEQYREGETDYTRVIQAQQTLLQVESTHAEARGNVASSLIATYKALGGGWEMRNGLKDLVPEDIRDEMRERTDWGDYLDAM
jgi:NodT family efflux transporter outer membrane factor (OMF) lipoprotein